MRDPARIDRVIAKLRAVWERNPDMRLCQTMYWLVTEGNSGAVPNDIFHIEDDVIERGLDRLAKDKTGAT